MRLGGQAQPGGLPLVVVIRSPLLSQLQDWGREIRPFRLKQGKSEVKRMIGAACLVATDYRVGSRVRRSPTLTTAVGAHPWQARACEVHSENNGQSYARGLQCAPALTVTVVGPSSDQPLACSIHVQGLVSRQEVLSTPSVSPSPRSVSMWASSKPTEHST